MSSTRIWILIGGAFIAAGGAAWTLRDGSAKADRGVPVPEGFTVNRLKEKMDEPKELVKLFKSTQYSDLTEEQRKQVGKNKGRAYVRMWEDRADEYSEADEAEREAILDRHLDDFLREKEQYAGAKAEKQKKEGEAKQRPTGKKGRGGGWSRQQLKAKSESGSPDQRARMAAYKTAMTRRAQARGLKF